MTNYIIRAGEWNKIKRRARSTTTTVSNVYYESDISDANGLVNFEWTAFRRPGVFPILTYGGTSTPGSNHRIYMTDFTEYDESSGSVTFKVGYIPAVSVKFTSDDTLYGFLKNDFTPVSGIEVLCLFVSSAPTD